MERPSPNIARADISLAALKNNFDLAQKLAPQSKAIAVIKAAIAEGLSPLPADTNARELVESRQFDPQY